MKICLINPPQILDKRLGPPYIFQPLGLLYIAAVLEKENQLQNGKYIFVAKNDIFERDYKTLQKDFKYAIKKLGLFE